MAVLASRLWSLVPPVNRGAAGIPRGADIADGSWAHRPGAVHVRYTITYWPGFGWTTGLARACHARSQSFLSLIVSTRRIGRVRPTAIAFVYCPACNRRRAIHRQPAVVAPVSAASTRARLEVCQGRRVFHGRVHLSLRPWCGLQRAGRMARLPPSEVLSRRLRTRENN